MHFIDCSSYVKPILHFRDKSQLVIVYNPFYMLLFGLLALYWGFLHLYSLGILVYRFLSCDVFVGFGYEGNIGLIKWVATLINVKCRSKKLQTWFVCSHLAVFCTNHHPQGASSQMGNFVCGCLCFQLIAISHVYHRIVIFLFLLNFLNCFSLHCIILFYLPLSPPYAFPRALAPLYSVHWILLFCESLGLKGLLNPAWVKPSSFLFLNHSFKVFPLPKCLSPMSHISWPYSLITGLCISPFLVNAEKKKQPVLSLTLFWSAAQTYMIVPTVLAAVPS